MNEYLSTWLAELQERFEVSYESELVLIAAANLLRNQGFSLRQIGNGLGRSHEWVRAHLCQSGPDSGVVL